MLCSIPTFLTLVINLTNLSLQKIKDNKAEKFIFTPFQTSAENYQEIALSACSTPRPPAAQFANFTNLERLEVSGCRLRHLADGTFRGLDQLTLLSLNDNAITTMDANLFADVPYLEELDLSNNKIRLLAENLLAPATLVCNRFSSGRTKSTKFRASFSTFKV